MTADASKRIYRFDRFVLDLVRGALLTTRGEPLSLRPRSFALLRLLVENAGRLLNHDEIMRAVWPNVTVTDESVVQCIRDIRLALGVGTDGFIRTLPRRGYVFSAQVQITNAAAGQAHGDGRPVIAVPPFTSQIASPGSDPAAEWIADDIIAELLRGRVLTVNAKPACPADYLMQGSVRREVGQVMIGARIIDLSDGAYLWSKRYGIQPNPGDYLSSDIAPSIAIAAERAISAAERRRALRTQDVSPGPRGLYHQGLWHIWKCTSADNEKAQQSFLRAVSLNPGFASAHTGLAMVSFNEGIIYGSRPAEESVKQAATWARMAVALDPDDVDARSTLALTTFVAGHIDESWTDITRALAEHPDSPWAQGVSGTIRMYAGDPADGRTLLLDALRKAPHDPGNAIIMTQIAISHYLEGSYDAAVNASRRAILHYPDHPIAYRWLAIALGQQGFRQPAKEALKTALTAAPQTFQRYFRGRPPWMSTSDYAHVLDGQRMAADG